MMTKIYVTKSSMPPIEEYIDEIKELWDSHWLTNMGKKYRIFQDQLKQYLKVSNVEMLTNGHMALELTIQALKLNACSDNHQPANQTSQKPQIITTPFTFASTTHAIVRNGIEPVFCDIKKDDFTIDEDQIESLITDYTVAIMPVHVYGNVCNVDKIQKIADKYELKVIYDAAHSFSETYNGQSVASFGDVSCYSFHATKVFNTIEGGAVCFRDENFGRELCSLKNFGIKSETLVDGVGANAKMNEFSAALGICNLRHLSEEIEKRKVATNCYDKELSGIPGIQIRNIQKKVTSNYAYYPIIVNEKEFGATRNEIYEKLAEHGVFSRKYFYPLTNTFDCYHGMYDVSATPTALSLSKRVLCLPLYAGLQQEEIIMISNLLKSAGK